MSDWTDAGLPLPDNNPSGQARFDIATTQMDTGLDRRRKRSNTKVKSYNLQWTLTGEEFADFEEYYATDLNNGVDYFTIDLPVDGVLTPLSVRFSGEGYNEVYRDFDIHIITATVTVEILQDVAEPDVSPQPIFFQPEVTLASIQSPYTVPADEANAVYNVTVDGEETEFRFVVPNNFPIAINATGTGKVILSSTPPPVPVTWEQFALDNLTLIGMYRADNPSNTYNGTGTTQLNVLADLSGNGRNLVPRYAQTPDVVSGWIRDVQNSLKSLVAKFSDNSTHANMIAIGVFRFKTASAVAQGQPFFGIQKTSTSNGQPLQLLLGRPNNSGWYFYDANSGSYVATTGAPSLAIDEVFTCTLKTNNSSHAVSAARNQQVWVNNSSIFNAPGFNQSANGIALSGRLLPDDGVGVEMAACVCVNYAAVSDWPAFLLILSELKTKMLAEFAP